MLLLLSVGVKFAVHGYRGMRAGTIEVGKAGFVHGRAATRWGWVYIVTGVGFAAFGIGLAILVR
ncbi:MAG TPA: hypothetical protein VE964_02770 [Myxococcales bacterium]|nr:hypothetical protein [Myxococcales bacterium]